MHPKTITDASQVHREWYPGAFEMLHQTITDAPEDHRRCSLGASWMVPKTILYAWSKHRRYTPGAFEMLSKTIAYASQYRSRGSRVVQLVDDHQEQDDYPEWPSWCARSSEAPTSADP